MIYDPIGRQQDDFQFKNVFYIYEGLSGSIVFIL